MNRKTGEKDLKDKQDLTFEEALEKISAIQQTEYQNEKINFVAKTIGLAHAEKTPKVILFYHGYTNCPKQFEELGKQIFNLGYNVYIPRLKYHGYRTKRSKEMKRLTVKDLSEYIGDSLQIAHALGDEVIVAGISGGATLCLQAGLDHNLKKVIAIAPLIDPDLYPKKLRSFIIILIQLLPNMFIWWDKKLKTTLPSPHYTYSWFSTKAVGRFLQIASTIGNSLPSNSIKTKDFTFLLSEADKVAPPQRLKSFITKFEKSQCTVNKIVFLRSENIIHDMIDPNQEGQKVSVVYPRLIEALLL